MIVAHPGVPTPASPQPPPGPGVQPPFVAPPTDGARQRRWWALGLAGAAVLVCCAGGVFGAGGLLVLTNQMVLESAQGAVNGYLTAVRDEDYAEAYSLLCDRERVSIDEGEFIDMHERAPLRSFTVGEAALESLGDNDRLVVPATLQYADGRSDAVRYLIDGAAGAFTVCGQVG
jgi:hypothetical protein